MAAVLTDTNGPFLLGCKIYVNKMLIPGHKAAIYSLNAFLLPCRF
jgi:hypothetical protein